jgi:hypothetical protein
MIGESRNILMVKLPIISKIALPDTSRCVANSTKPG